MVDAGFHDALKATEPKKAHKMPPKKVIEYEQYFAEQLPNFGSDAREQNYRQQCQNRMDELRSLRQHRESKRTTLWVAGVTAAVSILVALVFHILSSLRSAPADR